MSMLQALMSHLTRVYDRTPGPYLAIRLTYPAGSLQWQIVDDMLTVTVSGGIGTSLSVDLSQYTIGSLVDFLAAQPGYVVLYIDPESTSLSALALADGSGDQAVSNGDHIYGASNLNWILMSAVGKELRLAQDAIVAGLLETSTTTADGEWLDLQGKMYAVPRELNEQDAQYGPRIAAEVALPRQNNVAIEAALEAATGQFATVTDVTAFGSPFPLFDGSISHSGQPFFYNALAKQVFNLFDVAIGYDLIGSYSPADFATKIRQQVNRLRAAGTHLRTLTLTGSVMGDTVPMASDAMVENWSIRSLLGITVSTNAGLGRLNSDFIANPSSHNTSTAVLTSKVQLATGGTVSLNISTGALTGGH